MMRNIIKLDTDALWQKVGDWALKAGRVATRPVLLLWFVMTDKKTPKADKLMVLSAISYLVLPIDILNAKRLPIIGWLDEIVSISVAYQKVSKHITPEMQDRADALLDKWFPEFSCQRVQSRVCSTYAECSRECGDGEYTPYEMIED